MNNDKIVEKFSSYLSNEGVSDKSIKNYRSDLNHFRSWVLYQLKSKGVLSKKLSDMIPYLTSALLIKYRQYLLLNKTPVATLNRRLSSLRKFAKFLDSDIADNLKNVATSKKKAPVERDLVKKFAEHLGSTSASKSTIKNYVSDARHFVSWLEKDVGFENLDDRVAKRYFRDLSLKLKESTVKRRVTSINKFLVWSGKDTKPVREPQTRSHNKKGVYISAGAIFAGLVILLWTFLPRTSLKLPKILSSEDEVAVSNDWTVYTQIALTGSDGAPLSENVSVTFKLYEGEKSEEVLWSSEPINLFLDENGSALVALRGVPKDMYFNSPELYLSANIEGEEISQRLRVPTASGSVGGGGSEYFDEEGNLLFVSETPKITAEIGDLLIEGKSVTVSTPTASDGDITINPDGFGRLNMIFEGPVGNQINATAANLMGGALYYGYVGNNYGGAKLIDLQSGSSPTSKFLVDGMGNTQVGGELSVKGDHDILGDLYLDGVKRFDKKGGLDQISGYLQTSGLFEFIQRQPDQMKVTKAGQTALSDSSMFKLDEATGGYTASDYDTLVLQRLGGTSDAFALDVRDGNVNVAGSVTVAGGLVVRGTALADLAEYYPSVESLDVGEVVALDPNNRMHISKSQQEHQEGLFGVISTSPGVVLGQGEEYENNAYPVALVGRVPVLVAQGSKRIKAGDYLTSSEVAGRAKKVEGSGMVIGRALEDWDGGSDRVLVFVEVGYYEQERLIPENVKSASDVVEMVSVGAGEAIEVGGVFGKYVADSIAAGLVETKELVADTKIVSPIVETNVISPIPEENGFAKLLVEGSIEVEGDATIEGKVVVSEIEVQEATVAGTLYASEIESTTLEGIEQTLRRVEEEQKLMAEAETWNGVLESVGDIFVTGQATINTLSIVDSFVLGSDIVMQSSGENTINSLSAPLKLQSLALAPIELMAGKIKIDTLGDVEILGNLNVAGAVEAGEVRTDGVYAKRLIIASENVATGSAEVVGNEITTNAAAGRGVISAGEVELIVNSSAMTDYSMVYVTPTSSTQNQVLYVKSKQGTRFVVGFEQPIEVDVAFDWWIIDIEEI